MDVVNVENTRFVLHKRKEPKKRRADAVSCLFPTKAQVLGPAYGEFPANCVK
jgi:hypothetical protein